MSQPIINHSCIFCRIWHQQEKIVGSILAETENFYCIHQQQPISVLGWLLIVPKNHVTDQTELTEKMSNELSNLQMNMTRLLKDKTKAERIYWTLFSEKVKHIHFHLIPRMKNLPEAAFGAKIFDWTPENSISELEVDGFCDYLLQK